jgi:hypothetical protein
LTGLSKDAVAGCAPFARTRGIFLDAAGCRKGEVYYRFDIGSPVVLC